MSRCLLIISAMVLLRSKTDIGSIQLTGNLEVLYFVSQFVILVSVFYSTILEVFDSGEQNAEPLLPYYLQVIIPSPSDYVM